MQSVVRQFAERESNREPNAIRRGHHRTVIMREPRNEFPGRESYSALAARNLSLVILGVFLGSVFLALTIFVLDVFVVNDHGLVHLGPQSTFIRGTDPISEPALGTQEARNSQIDQLVIVHLEKHARDLTSQLWLHIVDLWVKSLSKHLLLLAGGSSVQGGDVDARSAGGARL